jgi:haloacetate dehalogenase
MTSVLAEAFRAVGRLFDMKAIWSEMAENLSVAPDQKLRPSPAGRTAGSR